MVVIKTARGLWKLCPNFDCPGKEEEEKAKAEKKGARGAVAVESGFQEVTLPWGRLEVPRQQPAERFIPFRTRSKK